MSPFLETPVEQRAPTLTYHLYMAGDYNQARIYLSRYVATHPGCFSISPCEYIYSGGMESGFKITLINYPRFPSTQPELWETMCHMSKLLMEHLGQGSFTIESPRETVFYSRRK